MLLLHPDEGDQDARVHPDTDQEHQELGGPVRPEHVLVVNQNVLKTGKPAPIVCVSGGLPSLSGLTWLIKGHRSVNVFTVHWPLKSKRSQLG